MGVPLLLGSSSNTLSAAERFSAAARGLRLLGWTGLLAVILGVSDLLFAVTMGAQAASAGGFAAVATAFGHLVLLGAGAGALAASACGLGVQWYLRAVGGLCVLLALTLVAVLLLWSGSAIAAVRAELPVEQHANTRVVVRVLGSALAFGTLFVTLAVACLRSSASGARATIT